MTTEEKIDDLLTRGVVSFVDPQGRFKEKLLKKAKNETSEEIVIKFGVDPTRPDIHLGHAVVLQKLRKFQDLGCKVVFLVGDFTSLIGDPTGKSKVRPEVNQEEIEVNMKTYLNQVGKILLTDPHNFSWIRNSEWFLGVTDVVVQGAPQNLLTVKANNGTSMVVDQNSFVAKAAVYENTRMQITELKKEGVWGWSLLSTIAMLRKISHSQLIERDMFQERIKNGEPLFMHEMLYPVLQGIDSNAIANIYGSCDLEIGGSDQTFNMLLGRKTMDVAGMDEQAVISTDILVGTDGKEKMSKSLDNYIGINDEPRDMFGKIMSISDSIIVNYYKLCTTANSKRLEEVKQKLEDSKVNPRDVKLDLAEEIVSMYHGKDEALRAREAFLSTFQKKEIPDDLEEIKGEGKLGELLKSKEIVSSMNDWRRLVGEGAVKRLHEDGGEEKLTNDLELATPGVYKIGKRRFVKIV